MAAVIDTSGSVGDAELGRALAEVRAIASAAGGTVDVVACDTSVTVTRDVRNPTMTKLVGGGGTDMAAGMDAAGALRPACDLIVVLTDGVTPWPRRRPRQQVLAVISGDGPDAPAWATTVRVS